MIAATLSRTDPMQREMTAAQCIRLLCLFILLSGCRSTNAVEKTEQPCGTRDECYQICMAAIKERKAPPQEACTKGSMSPDPTIEGPEILTRVVPLRLPDNVIELTEEAKKGTGTEQP